MGQVPMGPPNRPEVLRRSPIWRPLGTGRSVTIGSTRPLLPHRPAWPVSSGPTQCPVTQRAGHLDVHSHMPPLPGAPPVCLVAGRGRGEAEWGPSLERGEPDSSEGAPALGPAPRPHPLQGGWGRVGPVSGRALQSCLRWEGPPCSSLTAVLEAEGPRSFPSGLARRRAALSPLGKCQSLRGRERAERVPLERAMSGLLWGRASGPFGCLLYG